jgi:AcrR family transcriptional regulator
VSTRDKLIDAAFRVVARDGLEAASVKAIAAEAEVAPGLMHYHFATKDAVLDAAMQRSVDAFRARGAARRANVPPERQLAAYIEDVRDSIERERDFYRVRLALAARALSHPPTAALLAAQTAAAVEETALTLAAAMDDAPSDRHRAVAHTLKAMFDGIMLAALIDPAFPIEAAAGLIEGSLKEWLTS